MATPFTFQDEPNYITGLELLEPLDEHYLFNMDLNSLATDIVEYQTTFPSVSVHLPEHQCDQMMLQNPTSLAKGLVRFPLPADNQMLIQSSMRDNMIDSRSEPFPSTPCSDPSRASDASNHLGARACYQTTVFEKCQTKDERLQRNRRNRHPPHVKKLLEDAYKENPRPSREKCQELMRDPYLTDLKVYNFFKNKRQQQRAREEKNRLAKDLCLFPGEVNKKYKNPQLRAEMRYKSKTERAKHMAVSNETQIASSTLPTSPKMVTYENCFDARYTTCRPESEISLDALRPSEIAFNRVKAPTKASRPATKVAQSATHHGFVTPRTTMSPSPSCQWSNASSLGDAVLPAPSVNE